MACNREELILGGQVSEDGRERIEVALLRLGNRTRLELRLLSWGEGIGWYVQKRIQLDPLQIRALKEILGRGEGFRKPSLRELRMTPRINQEARENPSRAKVVHLPPMGAMERAAD